MSEENKFRKMLETEHAKALNELVKNKHFRFYMSELIGYCKTFENAFSEKGNVAAFNNGLQAAGQKIFNDIMAISPETYIKMCQEENELLAMRSQLKEDNNG